MTGTQVICDRCSRGTDSYIISLGMKICGVCKFEVENGKPNKTIECPYCTKEWDLSKNKTCQCGATI